MWIHSLYGVLVTDDRTNGEIEGSSLLVEWHHLFDVPEPGDLLISSWSTQLGHQVNDKVTVMVEVQGACISLLLHQAQVNDL